MLTNVYGGMASGFYTTNSVIYGGKTYSWNTPHTQSWNPTVGIRFKF